MKQADKLAQEHFLKVKLDPPDVCPTEVAFQTALIWRKVLTIEESYRIFNVHVAMSPEESVGGNFLVDGNSLVRWYVIDGFLITFKQYLVSDVLTSPLVTMNEVVKQAADESRDVVGLMLVSVMLRQVSVIAVFNDTLILMPAKPLFYRSILKRQTKMLEAIQLVKPEIKHISLIPGA